MTPLGPLFKELRKSLNLGQVEMAKELGVSQSALSKIEAGKLKPTLETFRRAAKRTFWDAAELQSEFQDYIFFKD